MRILFISDVTSIHLRRWADFMLSRNHNVTILSVRPGKLNGAKVFYLDPGDGKALYLFKWMRHFIFICFELLLILFGKYDIVHVHFLRADLTGLIAMLHKNGIISIWGSDARLPSEGGYPERIACKRWALYKATIITAVHQSLADRIKVIAPRLKTVIIIPFGADLPRFSKIPKLPGKNKEIRFCSAKPLQKDYGTDLLLEAFAIVNSQIPDSTLTIIGTGNEEFTKYLKNLIISFKLTECVKIVGNISDQEYDQFLSKSDIFISTSRWDAFGVALLEALATGMPVIATNVGGTRDIIINGETGLLIPVNDMDATIQAMLLLSKNEILRAKLGNAGKLLVHHKFGFQFNAVKMENLYHDIIHARKLNAFIL